MISSFDEDLARLRDDALSQNVRCSMLNTKINLLASGTTADILHLIVIL